MTKVLLLLAAASLAAVPAREEVSKEFSRALTLPPGQRVSVENRNGDIAIRGASGSAASIRAFIRISAPERATAEQFANGVVIDVAQTAGELRVRVRYPEMPKPGGLWHRLVGGMNLGYTVRLELTLPETSPLTVRHAFGRVEVDDMKSGASVVNSNGPVTVRRGRGDHRLESEFGRIQVDRLAGNLSLVNSNGEVAASEVTGNVTAQTKFGSIELERIGGTIRALNSNASVSVTGAAGRTEIGTSFGAVTATRIKADLVVRNSNGDVEAADVAGGADITTSFGKVRFSNVGRTLLVRNSNGNVEGAKAEAGASITTSFGNVRLTDVVGDISVLNDNGAIDIRGINGGAQLRTKFGSIDASGIAKAVVATNDNGSITITDAQAGVTASSRFAQVKLDRVAGPVEVTNDNGGISALRLRRANPQTCEPVRLSTKFSAIRVELPAGAGYDLNASTRFGEIHSTVTIGVQGQLSPQLLVGKIGLGGCELRLTNDNGGIQINAAKN